MKTWIFILSIALPDALTKEIFKLKSSGEYGVSYHETACQPSNVIDSFINNNWICMNSPEWNENFRLNCERLLAGADYKKLATVLAYFGRYTGPALDVDVRMAFDQEGLKSMLSVIPTSTLQTFDTVILKQLIHLMDSTDFSKLTSSQIVDILNAPDLLRREFLMLLNSLTSIIESDASIKSTVIKLLTGRFASLKLWKLDEQLIELLSNDETFCTLVGPKQLLSVAEKRAKVNNVDSKCFAMVNWNPSVEEEVCDRRIRFFPQNITALMDRAMHKSCLRYLLKDQVSNYGTSLEDQTEQCMRLDVTELSTDGLSGLTSKCLLQRVENAKSPIKIGFGWAVMDDNILLEFGNDPTQLDNIDADDWYYISKKQKMALLEKPSVCSSFPWQAFLPERLDISLSCFNELSDNSKASAMLYANIPNDSLENVGSMEDWEISGPDGKTIKGISILKYGDLVPNIKALLDRMANNADTSPCEEIKDIKMLKELKVLQLFGNKKCFDSIKIDFTLESLKNLNPRAISLIDLGEIIKSSPKEAWNKFNPTFYGKLIESKQFCSHITVEMIPYLGGFWKLVDDKCGEDLKIWKDMGEKQYKLLPPDAFKLIDSTRQSELKLELVSDEQFGEIGSNVPRDRKPSSNWSPKEISGSSLSRIKYISPSNWGAVPPITYGGLSLEQFRVIPPSNMTEMDLERVEKIKSHVILTLSKAQAEMIGKTFDRTEKSPLTYLDKLDLQRPAKDEIKKRIP